MKTHKKVLTVLLLILCLFSTGMYVNHLQGNAAANRSYDQARALAAAGKTRAAASETVFSPETAGPVPQETLPAQKVYVPAPVEDDAYLEELKAMDLFELRQVNPDVVGWVLLPDTEINYPVVQGTDNEHYLKYTWDGQQSDSGSIFLECTNQPDMTEFHTILYGHNMINKTMFAQLRSYTTQAFWQQHPYVYLITQTGIFRYEIYASYLADVDGSTYQLGMQLESTRQRFIDYTLEQTVIDTGITPAVTDRILTLSTCSGMGYATRWVVHARLPMVEADA